MAPPRTIAITMGDPAGIGAEVVLKALRERAPDPPAAFYVFGDGNALMEHCRALGLPFELPGLSRAPERMAFDYSVLFDEDPSHRGFLIVEHNFATGTFANESGFSAVFSPGSRRQELDLTTSGWLRGFLALVRLGAEHVLLGLDHLFFLLALLLPVALRREGGGWQPLEGAGPALRRAAGIVGALAAALAVALALAALVHLPLPEALVGANDLEGSDEGRRHRRSP